MLFVDNVCEKIDSFTKGQKVAALVSSEALAILAEGEGEQVQASWWF